MWGREREFPEAALESGGEGAAESCQRPPKVFQILASWGRKEPLIPQPLCQVCLSRQPSWRGQPFPGVSGGTGGSELNNGLGKDLSAVRGKGGVSAAPCGVESQREIFGRFNEPKVRSSVATGKSFNHSFIPQIFTKDASLGWAPCWALEHGDE